MMHRADDIIIETIIHNIQTAYVHAIMSRKVAAVQNGQNSSEIFGFLTQMAHAFIQPACLVREFYLTHFFWAWKIS